MIRFIRLLLFLFVSTAALSQSQVEVVGSATINGTVTVGPQNTGVTLTSIAVSPTNPTQSVGQSVSFSANGTFSDGSTQDVTSQVLWTVASGTAATNVSNIYTCNSPGSVTVSAALISIVGMTTLTCQSLQINPNGTLTAFQSQLFAQLFVASGGTPPYTFSSSDLPSWLTLTNTGCSGSQINCDLTGTQSSLASYNFHITATDSISNTLTLPITVQVIAVGAEDNRYCNTNGTSNVAGQMDGPANMIQQCVYDAIANTPAVCIGPGCTVPTLFVCPSSQVDGSGIPISGCLHGTPPYYNTIQGAFNALTSCGQQIQIYDKSGFPTPVQNVYDEKLVLPSLSCGPIVTANNPNAEWVWVTTIEYSSLPAPGNRISPAWAGQTSVPGRPPFPGPSVPGVYVPFINPSAATCGSNPGCPILAIGGNGTAPSGFRFMGLELAWTKSHLTAPGYFGGQIQSGCSTNDCPQGASYIIFDRMISHACQDKSDVTCTDSAPVAYQLVNGNFQAVINSYFYGFKTIGDNQGFQGPQDESHGISGGNIQGTCHDGPNKIVNNFIDVASQPFFWGGSSSDSASICPPDGAHSYDLEIRRNSLFRPLTYMVGSFNPENNFAGGKIFDMFVGSKGTAYPPAGSVCSVLPPPAGGVQATCGLTVSGNKVTDATATTPGSGYISAQPGTVAWRYPNTDPACGTGFGCATPVASLSQNTTGGTISTGKKIAVVTVFVHAGDGYITDPALNNGGNPIYTNIITSGCTGGGCQVVVAHPTLPSGFSGYSVYSCDATNAACKGLLQTAANACVNITGDCTINAVGTGPGSGNQPSLISEANTQVEDGIYIVKNDGESKHVVRELFEANVATHLWTGQSDESSTCWLLRATNDIEQDGITQNCPNCRVNDVVYRYNACRGAATGFSFGVQQATRGGTIAESTGFISAHDNVFELSGMWITATNQFGSGGTLAVLTNNGQPGPQALQSISLNHNTVVHTEPASFSQQATSGSFVNLLTALCGQPGKNNTTAVLNAITFENNIGGGGFKNISQKSQGCFQCQQSGTCNSTLALSSKLTNSGLNPVVTGLYTRNEVTGVQLTNGGVCSVPPTTCTITNSTGTGATCGLILDKSGNLTGLSLGAFGQGYANSPSATTLTISGGTCSTTPTGLAFIGGSGNPSPSGAWCADHNMNITAGWPGEDAMLPDPTAQGDTVNACFSPTGGGYVDVTNLTNVQYLNFSYNNANNLPVDWGWVYSPTFIGNDDLHLSPTSPGHNTANGDTPVTGNPAFNDIGANIDLILKYTGCSIPASGANTGKMVCP